MGYNEGRKKWFTAYTGGDQGTVAERAVYTSSTLTSTTQGHINDLSRVFLNEVNSITLASYNDMWSEYDRLN